jgi:integrase
MTDLNERTFRDLCRELRAAGRSEKTISAYHQACLSLERFLTASGDDEDLTGVSRGQLQDWLISLQDTHKPDSIVSYFRSIRRVCNWLEAEELLDGPNPVARMALPKESGKPVAIPDTDAIRAVLAACAADKTWMGRRDEAIVRLFCQAGAPRCGEVAALDIGNVNLDADMVTVSGKTGWRPFPLEPKTARAFSRWNRARNKREADREERFFISARGGGLTENGIYQLVERRCAQAGVERIHPHQFRHWSTDRMLDSGLQEGQVMVLNGWTSRAMLERYGKARGERRAADAARQAGIGGVL